MGNKIKEEIAKSVVDGFTMRGERKDAVKGSVQDTKSQPTPMFERYLKVRGFNGEEVELKLVVVERVKYSTDPDVQDVSVFEGYKARYRSPGESHTCPKWTYNLLVLDCGVEMCSLVPYGRMSEVSSYMERSAYEFGEALTRVPFMTDLRVNYVQTGEGATYWDRLDAMKTWVKGKLRVK